MAFPIMSDVSDPILFQLWEGQKGRRSNKLKDKFIEAHRLWKRTFKEYEVVIEKIDGLLNKWKLNEVNAIIKAYLSISEFQEIIEDEQYYDDIYYSMDYKKSGIIWRERRSKCIICGKPIPANHHASHLITKDALKRKGDILNYYGNSIINIIPVDYDCHMKLDHDKWEDGNDRKRLMSLPNRLHERNGVILDLVENDIHSLKKCNKKISYIYERLPNLYEELEDINLKYTDSFQTLMEKLRIEEAKKMEKIVLKEMRTKWR